MCGHTRGPRRLISKPRILGFGLNLQHCAHVCVFPSHSYEQYYQAIRRCWRYGQTREVVVDVVSSAGEADVLGNLRRKADAADRMFEMLVAHMREAAGVVRSTDHLGPAVWPPWLAEEASL